MLDQLLHLCGTCGTDRMIATNLTGTLANLALLEANRPKMLRGGVHQAIAKLCRALTTPEVSGASDDSQSPAVAGCPPSDACSIAQPLEFAVRCLATLSYDLQHRVLVTEGGIQGCCVTYASATTRQTFCWAMQA